jgi:hypothetical protein
MEASPAALIALVSGVSDSTEILIVQPAAHGG